MKFDSLLIDGPYMGMMSHHAPYKLTNSRGLDATLVHGFFKSLNSLNNKFEPRRIVIAWESYGTSSWRKAAQEDYKEGRTKMAESYWEALKDVQDLVHLLGVEQFYSPHNEADDVIATLAKGKSVIFTTDKDLMQLVGDEVVLWNGKVLFDSDKVEEKYMVRPNQISDLLAIWGDTSDNIKGLDGYGVVKGSRLLKKYGSVEGIPEDDDVGGYKKQLVFNKKMATLLRDCELKSLPKEKVDSSIDDILNKYELKKIRGDVLGFNKKKGLNKWL